MTAALRCDFAEARLSRRTFEDALPGRTRKLAWSSHHAARGFVAPRPDRTPSHPWVGWGSVGAVMIAFGKSTSWMLSGPGSIKADPSALSFGGREPNALPAVEGRHLPQESPVERLDGEAKGARCVDPTDVGAVRVASASRHRGHAIARLSFCATHRSYTRSGGTAYGDDTPVTGKIISEQGMIGSVS